MSNVYFEQVILPDTYDTNIEILIGRYILLCGQIDRWIIHAVQMKSFKKLTCEDAVAIARHGIGKTLEKWIVWFEEKGDEHKFDLNWKGEVISYLKKIKDFRNKVCHDSLVKAEDGSLKWKTNEGKGNRDHEDFDIQKLHFRLHEISSFKKFLFLN